ncbi:MAG: tripartite tricarboxylate transporter substrate binding protein [Burkholderiales bacterium]|nr:tripartite tricarboxylate transporter substrate binding protein [Burkholderiales bacterium]
MNTGKNVVQSLLLGAGWTLAAALPGTALAQTGWKPERPVEIVVGTSPGGGQDTSARFVQKLVQERQLIEVPSNVVNKPGGGSAIGYAYLNQHAGSGHHIMLLTVPLIVNHIMGLSPISYNDLSPLATLFDEYIVAAVLPDSPLRSGKDLLERLRKDVQSVSVGIPSVTGGGNFGIVMAAKAVGADPRKLKSVVFKSGGDSVTALLGGHVDVMMSTTAAPVRQRRQGKMRIIAIAAPKRVGGELADVPTFREQGADVVFANWRGIVGPRGLSPEQVAYWEGVFARLVATDEFKEDLARNQWVTNFLRSAEMRKFLATQNEQLKVLLADLGMAK